MEYGRFSAQTWDEAYYVIEGQVRFSVAEQEEIVKAGEFLYGPAGTLHGLQGDAENPARMLSFDAPAVGGLVGVHGKRGA